MFPFLFSVMPPLNIPQCLSRWEFAHTKSDTIRVPKDTMELFGEWLQRQRNQRRLTREEFAKRVGCSVSALQKIEYGERRPSAQIAELMANCLEIPLEQKETFIRVARGELGMERLSLPSNLVAHPDISPTSAVRVKLPAIPTPLIGRQREVNELTSLLRDPQCRLLTLVGAGGIGKTRLAIETASQLQEAFADGVFLVPLASVNSTQFIAPMIADALGFAFQSASRVDLKTQLFNYLKEKRVLLLTDNLEHLLSLPGVEILSELLSDAPQIKLLVTSRESLGLQGEWVFEVHGLPVPENAQADGIIQNTSVELFLQRARRAYVEFNATPEDFPAILRICHLVDGMPLAIELAAAWVRSLTCAEIAIEIEHSLDFLSVSTRDIPTRHRSMRAVFDHSWKLIAEEEKQILARLSVFRGGFTREAAEQVAEATLAVLATVVTKSLLRRNSAGRYDLHELIRQFTAEYFSEQSQDQSAIQARHGSYYLTYFAQADTRIRSTAQREALAGLTIEMDNFRIAWAWAVAHNEFGLIERTMRMAVMFFDTLGWLQEGLDLLGGAIRALEAAYGQLPPDRESQIALGHILSTRSVFAARAGQLEQAQGMLERSIEILRPLNEPRVLVEAFSFLGNVMEFMGNHARAMELYTEGLEMAKSVGDQWFAGFCHLCLFGEGSLRQPTTRPENVHEELRNIVVEWRLIGDPRITSVALNNLSLNAVKLERYGEARAALEESISLNTSIGDRWILGFAYRGLGRIAQAQGNHAQAVEMFRKCLAMFAEVGTRQDETRILSEMCHSLLALGNDTEAERGWREVLRVTAETQSTFAALDAISGIAALKAKQGNIEQAFELALFVLNHSAAVQDTKDRAAHLRAKLESQLTQAQITTVQTQATEKAFGTVTDDLLK